LWFVRVTRRLTKATQIEFHDISAVQLEAIKSAGEILRDLDYPIGAGSEWRMEVVDEARKPLFSLRVIAELHE